jgi:hypothetical protein
VSGSIPPRPPAGSFTLAAKPAIGVLYRLISGALSNRQKTED